MSASVVLQPGQVTLAQWRALYRGAEVTLDPACAQAVLRSAQTVEAIVARGEPVYGVNTGFGKLASVRIERDDLQTLQRNIVLSHAAGVGDPTPVPVVRLMMALKLTSLAQGASGIQPDTLALLEAMLRQGITPVVPCQGSVGASGDLAPLSHLAAVMIGVGEAFVGDQRLPAADALARAQLQPRVLGAKEGLALLNGTSSPPPARWPACSRSKPCCRPRWSPARCRWKRPRARTRPSMRASMPCAGNPGRSQPRPPCVR